MYMLISILTSFLWFHLDNQKYSFVFGSFIELRLFLIPLKDCFIGCGGLSSNFFMVLGWLPLAVHHPFCVHKLAASSRLVDTWIFMEYIVK